MRLAPSIETGARPALVVSGRRSSVCSLRSSPRVGAVMRLRVSRYVLAMRSLGFAPFGSHVGVRFAAVCPSRLPTTTTSPSHCALRPPGQGGGRTRRAIDACASRRCRRLLLCNQQFSMSTRESRDFRSARAEPPSALDLAPVVPLRFAGRCFVVFGRRRRAVVSARRTRMAVQLGHTADRGLEPHFARMVLHPGKATMRGVTRRPLRGPHILRTRAESPRHGRSCSPPTADFGNAAGDQTPWVATHHVANLGARSAFYRWV